MATSATAKKKIRKHPPFSRATSTSAQLPRCICGWSWNTDGMRALAARSWSSNLISSWRWMTKPHFLHSWPWVVENLAPQPSQWVWDWVVFDNGEDAMHSWSPVPETDSDSAQPNSHCHEESKRDSSTSEHANVPCPVNRLPNDKNASINEKAKQKINAQVSLSTTILCNRVSRGPPHCFGYWTMAAMLFFCVENIKIRTPHRNAVKPKNSTSVNCKFLATYLFLSIRPVSYS